MRYKKTTLAYIYFAIFGSVFVLNSDLLMARSIVAEPLDTKKDTQAPFSLNQVQQFYIRSILSPGEIKRLSKAERLQLSKYLVALHQGAFSTQKDKGPFLNLLRKASPHQAKNFEALKQKIMHIAPASFEITDGSFALLNSAKLQPVHKQPFKQKLSPKKQTSSSVVSNASSLLSLSDQDTTPKQNTPSLQGRVKGDAHNKDAPVMAQKDMHSGGDDSLDTHQMDLLNHIDIRLQNAPIQEKKTFLHLLEERKFFLDQGKKATRSQKKHNTKALRQLYQKMLGSGQGSLNFVKLDKALKAYKHSTSGHGIAPLNQKQESSKTRVLRRTVENMRGSKPQPVVSSTPPEKILRKPSSAHNTIQKSPLSTIGQDMQAWSDKNKEKLLRSIDPALLKLPVGQQNVFIHMLQEKMSRSILEAYSYFMGQSGRLDSNKTSSNALQQMEAVLSHASQELTPGEQKTFIEALQQRLPAMIKDFYKESNPFVGGEHVQSLQDTKQQTGAFSTMSERGVQPPRIKEVPVQEASVEGKSLKEFLAEEARSQALTDEEALKLIIYLNLSEEKADKILQQLSLRDRKKLARGEGLETLLSKNILSVEDTEKMQVWTNLLKRVESDRQNIRLTPREQELVTSLEDLPRAAFDAFTNMENTSTKND